VSGGRAAGWRTTAATGAALGGLAAAVAGCASAARRPEAQAGEREAPSAAAPCEGAAAARGLVAEELGYSLAIDVGRVDPAGVRELMARLEVAVEVTAEPVPAAALLASAAGAPRCAFPERDPRAYVAGRPPRALLASFPPAALERLEQGAAHVAAGRFAEARLAFASGRAAVPAPTPAFDLARADSYRAEGRDLEAAAGYRDVAGRDPGNPEAFAGLGAALAALGRLREALGAFGRALALRPGSVELARAAASLPAADLAQPVLPPALRIPGAGGARWAAPRRAGAPEALASAEAAAYARCKELFRRSEEARAALLPDAADAWRWSPAEEAVCTAAWLEVYTRHRRELARAADPALDELVEIHQAGFAVERALFDVGARVHPTAPRLLGPRARGRLFAFATRFRVREAEAGGLLLFP
jgi:tetratricopeptide (TPR) repeat protein